MDFGLRSYRHALSPDRAAHLFMHGRAPVHILGDVAAHHVEIESLEGAPQLTYAAVAHRAVVHRADRGNLSARAAQDKLVAYVKLRAVYLALDQSEIETLSATFKPGARAGERYDPGYFVTLGA